MIGHCGTYDFELGLDFNIQSSAIIKSTVFVRTWIPQRTLFSSATTAINIYQGNTFQSIFILQIQLREEFW